MYLDSLPPTIIYFHAALYAIRQREKELPIRSLLEQATEVAMKDFWRRIADVAVNKAPVSWCNIGRDHPFICTMQAPVDWGRQLQGVRGVQLGINMPLNLRLPSELD